MNIIERGRVFLQSLQALAARSAWDWQRGPACGSLLTIQNGSYTRRPWFFSGTPARAGATPAVPRLRQVVCGAVGAAGAGQLVRSGGAAPRRGSLARLACQSWAPVLAAHGGVSAFVAGAPGTLADMAALGCGAARRSLLSGRQYGAALAPSVGPGWPAQASVPGPLQGLAQSAELGTAGLWARLRGGATRVVLLLADSVTGLLWPPVVAEREDQAEPWQRLFARARVAGPDWQHIRGVTSDGAQGLSALLGHTLSLGAAPALRLAHLAHLRRVTWPGRRRGCDRRSQ